MRQNIQFSMLLIWSEKPAIFNRTIYQNPIIINYNKLSIWYESCLFWPIKYAVVYSCTCCHALSDIDLVDRPGTRQCYNWERAQDKQESALKGVIIERWQHENAFDYLATICMIEWKLLMLYNI